MVNPLIPLLLRSHIGMWHILPNLWMRRIEIASQMEVATQKTQKLHGWMDRLDPTLES